MAQETFLELVERIDGERASARTIFASESRDGYASARRAQPSVAWNDKVLFLAETIAKSQRGSVAARLTLQEAMSTSDFPNLFGDIIDRTLLGGFREYPEVFRAFAAVKEVRDFRAANIFAAEGGESQLSQVAQGAEYQASNLIDEKDTIAVGKYGRRLPFTWETIVNDDLGAFLDNVARLGRAARRTRQKNVTKLYVDANGPHASLYTSGNKNIVNTTNGASATNPALSPSAVMDALIVLSKMTDYDGEPIMVEGVVLVVPPALGPIAKNVLEAVEIRLTDRGGLTTETILVRNWLSGQITSVVDPYISQVATTNGNTSWFVFASPATTRASIMFATLAGHPEPELFMKFPNAVRVGGGEAGALDGSFETDSIDYKVRDVWGTARLANTLGYKSTVASNGSGA